MLARLMTRSEGSPRRVHSAVMYSEKLGKVTPLASLVIQCSRFGSEILPFLTRIPFES